MYENKVCIIYLNIFRTQRNDIFNCVVYCVVLTLSMDTSPTDVLLTLNVGA